MELEGHETTHILVFVDEARFNLSKGRRRSHYLIVTATTDTLGQRGANITMCAANSENGVSTAIPHIGPYNTQLLLAFLNTLYRDLIPEQERGLVRPHSPNYVVVIRCDAVEKSLAWPTRATGCPPRVFFFMDVILCICGNMECTVIGQARFHFTCNTFVQK